MAMPQSATEWAERGHACTQDCTGHERGYEWAEMNGISDPDECGGNSDSFIEGCRCFAEEVQEERQAMSGGWAAWVDARGQAGR